MRDWSVRHLMSGHTLLAWCLAGAMAVVSVTLAVLLFTAPIPRLHRFPEGDNVQQNGSLTIKCTAYSNRPDQNFNSSHPADYYGLRIVSDCVTVTL